MKTMAEVIRDAVEMTPYWTNEPTTHQDPYENAARAVVAAGFGQPGNPRERWRFLAREAHWGYTYLVWELVANPTGPRKVGARHARVQL